MSEDGARGRTDEALESAGLADMRPAYRRLLVRLKGVDPAAFEEASSRYRDDLEPAIAEQCSSLGVGSPGTIDRKPDWHVDRHHIQFESVSGRDDIVESG